jgi:hypothetical protein
LVQGVAKETKERDGLGRNKNGLIQSNGVSRSRVLKKLNWKTLEERRKEQKLAYVAKALSNQCPENVSTMFKISNSDKYNLRSNNKMLMLSKPKTNSMKRTFGYAAAKDWNYNSKNSKST